MNQEKHEFMKNVLAGIGACAIVIVVLMLLLGGFKGIGEDQAGLALDGVKATTKPAGTIQDQAGLAPKATTKPVGTIDDSAGSAKITIIKKVDPSVDTAGFKFNTLPIVLGGDFWLIDRGVPGENTRSFNVVPGTQYSIEEIYATTHLSSNKPDGLNYFSTSFECTSDIGTNNFSGTGRKIIIKAVRGENITCVVTNVPISAIITVVKETEPGESKEKFTFEYSAVISPKLVSSKTQKGSFQLVDNNNKYSLTSRNRYDIFVTKEFLNSKYVIKELNGVSDGYETKIKCVWPIGRDGSQKVVELTGKEISITPKAGENILCTVTNTKL